MKHKLHRSVVAVFCEDIRMEKAETVTLVGLYPDNIAVPAFPGLMPKLSLYVRGNFPVTKAPATFSLKLEFPWATTPVQLGIVEPEKIVAEVKNAQEKGNDAIGLLVYASFAPFAVQKSGRVNAIVSIGNEDWLVGSLNFLLAEKPPALEAKVAQVSDPKAPKVNKPKMKTRIARGRKIKLKR